MTLPGGETRILLVSRDTTTIESVELACQHADWLRFVGHVTRPDEAASVAQQRHANIILLDDSVLDATRQVVMDVALAAPDLLILVLVAGQNVEKVQEALLSGARGFITKPYSEQEFVDAISRIVTLENLRRTKEEKGQEARAHIITLLSAKGGVGKSVLAVNLALSLRDLDQGPILLVELMSLPGDVPILLNLLQPKTLEDVLDEKEALEGKALLSHLTQYDEDVYVLPSTRSYLGGDFEPEAVRTFLRLVGTLFRTILVDTGELQDPLTEVGLSEADRALIVMGPDLLALHRTIKFWQALKESDVVNKENIAFLLNQAGKDWGLSRSRLEQLLDVNFFAVVQYDANAVEDSIRRGVPVVRTAKRSRVAKDIAELARRLLSAEERQQPSATGEEEQSADEGKSGRSRWRFFALS